MNNYPAWWDQTITVYNKYNNPDTNLITWYSHIVTGCFWKYDENKISINNTILTANSLKCRIPKNQNYLGRFEWENLSDSDKYKYFTLSSGDIVVRGVADETINEYTPGQRSSDIIKKYKNIQGCMTISSCAINTGRFIGNEHYLIKGE